MSAFDAGAAKLIELPIERKPHFQLGSDVEIAEKARTIWAKARGELVFSRNSFWSYDRSRGVWTEAPDFEFERIVHGFDGAAMGEKAILKVKHGRVQGALSVAKAQLANPVFFDDAVDGLAFANTFIEVSANGLAAVPHSAEHRATSCAPFAFDSNAKCTRFLSALGEMFVHDDDRDDKIALLQEFTGACLVGAATRYALALVPIGVGANGKSVVLRVLLALFPAEASTSIAPQDFGQEYRRAMLASARINAVNEIPERDVIDSDAFKAVISGDQVVGRHIRQAPFTFRPRAGHVFAGNRLPGTTDQSHGFWRRLLPLPFTRTFAKHEQDAGLADFIVAHELPGVAAWALDGAARLLKTGRYTMPRSAVAARDDWQRTADQVRLFVDECARTSENTQTASKLLYDSYAEWARQNGHRAMASNKFAERMEAIGFERHRTRDGVMWRLELVRS